MTNIAAVLLFEVTDLKQWSYCPRVLYYRYWLPEIRPITDLIAVGIRSHADEAGREERRSLRIYGLSEGERAFDVGLRSAALQLRGRLNLAIAVPERAAPGAEASVVEYKDSEQRLGRTSSSSSQPTRCCWRKPGGCRCGADLSTASRCASRRSSRSRRRCGRRCGGRWRRCGAQLWARMPEPPALREL